MGDWKSALIKVGKYENWFNAEGDDMVLDILTSGGEKPHSYQWSVGTCTPDYVTTEPKGKAWHKTARGKQ